MNDVTDHSVVAGLCWPMASLPQWVVSRCGVVRLRLRIYLAET